MSLLQLHWTSLSDFIHMGGYGLYVWGSLLVTVLGLGLEWLLIKQQSKQVIRQLQRMALLKELERKDNDASS